MRVGSGVGGWTWPRLDRRTLLGVALAVVAAAAVLVLTRPQPTVSVLVAASDLPAGTPLADLDVGVRQVRDGSGLVTGTDLGELAGWTLRVPLHAGEPLLPSLLQPPALQDAPALIALEVDASHALLGRISPGDRVDVYVSRTVPGAAPVTERIADDVYVLEAHLSDSRAGRPRVDLLLAVDDELAAALAGALHAGELDLVRVGP